MEQDKNQNQNQNSNFQAVYNAALTQNEEALQAILNRGVNIDANQEGYPTPASELAKEGNEAAATWLLGWGAEVDFIARGAAIGGHWEYVNYLKNHHDASLAFIGNGAAAGGHRDKAESFRRQGAGIDMIADGAMDGGYWDYVIFLCNEGADIDWVRLGAEIGGHQGFEAFFRSQSANMNINWIARGAAMEGHWEYMQQFQSQGADIDSIVSVAVNSGHVNSSANSQLRFLASFAPDNIGQITSVFSRLNPLVGISQETRCRATEMFSFMCRPFLPMSGLQALARTDPDNKEVLYLLMLILARPHTLRNNQEGLSKAFLGLKENLMLYILSFLLPRGLTLGGIDQLGFFMARAYLGAQLYCYLRSDRVGPEDSRPDDFFKAVCRTLDMGDLMTLIHHSVEDQEHKHDQHPRNDRFNQIIFSWSGRQADEQSSSNKRPASPSLDDNEVEHRKKVRLS